MTTTALSPLRKQGDVSKDSTAPIAVLPQGPCAPPMATTSHEQGAKTSLTATTACTLGSSSSLLDTLAHCYTPHCTPRPSPYAYKRKVQGSHTRRLAARENGPTHKALALALSHANACNPLLQAHPSALGVGQHEGRGFPLLFSPLCVPSRADPSRLGHAATIYSSVQGPPGVETPTKGIFIQDKFVMVQQTARFLHGQKQPMILLKLDITKAFDIVSWPFLLDILGGLRFGRVWRGLISGRLSTSSNQILLNGVPGSFIMHQRGLRQGDPLFPMMFILVMDALNLMFCKADELGLLQPISSRCIQHRISLYVDDVILFLRASANGINLALRLLNLFGDATRLRTNIQKSGVVSIAIIQALLPCPMDFFPINYLVLPLSIRKLTKILLSLIDKLVDLLPRWRVDLMTRVSRLSMVSL
jgi:hypothetical protein